MAMGSWNWRIVVNRKILTANPSVQKLAEGPVQTWAAWESEINKNGSTERLGYKVVTR